MHYETFRTTNIYDSFRTTKFIYDYFRTNLLKNLILLMYK